ncbi:MAG TPA: glycosyltransferase [Solirubrobacterales bacterium]|nr:glycosyltransferase [Solirubrobacterales bacterium]
MNGPELVFALARGQNAFFQDLAQALVEELERLGASARIVVGEFPEQRQGSVTVLLPPHEYAALSQVRPTPAMLRRCVLISAEQPSTQFFDWNVELARDAGAVLDINGRAVRAYGETGIAAAHLQLGYSESWDRRAAVAERDIDVLFVGRSTKRREKALASYADALERLRCHILLSDDSTPNTDDGTNFLSGENKLRLLSRSKVLLNVHGEDEPYFEWLRVAEAMSCGCAVVTEHSTDLEPLRDGLDVISGRLESLGLLAAWLAEDDDARAKLVASADARLRERAPLAAAAATLLETAARADAIPVDPRAAGEVTVANARIAIASIPGRPGAPAEDAESGERQTLRALKRQQQEILSVRRQLAADALARSRPERPGAETVDVATTAAWEAAEPRVTVIVPLYNDEEVVVEALDSVRRSTFRAWEIVIVDDASGDGGPDAVRAWMRQHEDLPAAMIRHEVNRGLSAARNSGAAKARGRLFLMLDSDNLLRPLGLSRLVRALARDPHAAFAYGILDRFHEEGPVDLVSSYGWEPARFRAGNYIDALALIRRGAFNKLGGYSGDPRLLLGYEDYDFWARLAEAGQWAVFVRQFVGSYRVGHSSMLSMTNISKVDAMAAIAEHAPELMRGVELQT